MSANVASQLTRLAVDDLDTGKHSKQFTPLSKTRKAQTFAGDAQSLAHLRRRLERSNFVSTRQETVKKLIRRTPSSGKSYVVIVDAFSTGACLAYEAARRGYGLIHVLSLEPSDELAGMVPAHLRGALEWSKTLHVDLSVSMSLGAKKLAQQLEDLIEIHDGRLAAIVPGAETGVKLADFLSACIAESPDKFGTSRLATNGTRLTEARRNKSDMGDAVRRAGVRAVRQLRATEWEPVKAWLATDWQLENDDDSCQLIVKPMESAGSDGVTLCNSPRDVREAISQLVGSINGLGQTNEGVLVQEFLQGVEYVVDGVSRDNTHKVVAIWEYDRRPTNGAGFVLHGQKLLGGNHPVVSQIVPYAASVLTALELKHGPSHMEVKLTPHPNPAIRNKDPSATNPCLVEVGARCHGAEGFWISIADEACGRNQCVAACEAYLDPTSFDKLPPLPPAPLLNAACIKYLLTHQRGVLKSIHPKALETITQLESYRGHEIFIKIGSDVIPTKDCFSWAGCVKLVNPTDEGLDRDYKIIEQLCIEGLWDIAQ